MLRIPRSRQDACRESRLIQGSLGRKDSSYYAHPEPSPNVGWWLNNWSTNYINGCSGCSYIELAGYGDFKYDGEFDHTGAYENEYWNYDTGYANGTNSYYYSYYFKNTFFGWHKQDWCC